MNGSTWATCVAVLLSGGMTSHSPAAEAPKTKQLTLIVRETAGIRRFGYPVSTLLSLPEPLKDGEHFRLLDGGKPIPAQFRPHAGTGKGIRQMSLDFNVNYGPNESHEYVVEYGPKVQPPPLPQGMKVVQEKDQFRVVYSPSFQFIVPRNLLGLLRGVKTSKTDYLRADSAGLMIRSKDDMPLRAGGKLTVARVVKEGPLASTLRFENTESLRGGRSVKSVVEIEFPSSKSWVRVTWMVEDPEGYVSALGADLNLNIQGEPALVDFGAGSYVYAHLRKGQVAIMRQRIGKPRWETLVGPVGTPAPYVVAKPYNLSGKLVYPAAEGWAHVMDRMRCTALGVADFGIAREGSEITIDADGRLRIWKKYQSKKAEKESARKTFRFWLHFVDMPVQVGAVTSPQSMMAPLEDLWDQGGEKKK